MIGYKIIADVGNKGYGVSLYDKGLKISLKRGDTTKFDTGLFLGTSKKFVNDYYSGLTDYPDLLLTYEYDTADVMSGDPKSSSGEVKVRKATLTDVEKVIEERMEGIMADPSLQAPKKWWDTMVKQVKKGNPNYDDEQVRATVGNIWANLSVEKRKEIRSREGKTYGPAPESKSKNLLRQISVLEAKDSRVHVDRLYHPPKKNEANA